MAAIVSTTTTVRTAMNYDEYVREDVLHVPPRMSCKSRPNLRHQACARLRKTNKLQSLGHKS